MTLHTKPLNFLKLPVILHQKTVLRFYATPNSLGASNVSPQPRRKSVTPFNDDGQVPWRQLSAKEKVGRTTQQAFNLSLIIMGVFLTSGVAFVMYTEVFSLDSKTSHFNRAFDQVRKDPRCTALLGESKEIAAYGEPTFNRWKRARPIASTVNTDQRGNEHLIMHFNVQGPKAKGVVNLHMIKPASGNEFVYKYLALDVPGNQRLYLEKSDTQLDTSGMKNFKIFGVSWR